MFMFSVQNSNKYNCTFFPTNSKDKKKFQFETTIIQNIYTQTHVYVNVSNEKKTSTH